jgi:demethylmenaquinone methyltransferase/2-methoxy-6-polyprenyl-1,4-benzoquinol methylase
MSERSAQEGRAFFGNREVAQDAKQGLVDEVFRRVAGRYDLMNDLMSGGVHRLWKDALVSMLAPPRHDGAFEVLDLAGGTGDIAFRIVRRSDNHARVVVSDINPSMLAVGRDRADARGFGDAVSFVEANAEALPFDDGRFDAATIAFGIRNVSRIDAALAEAYRVLKRGGRFLCLEFSSVDVAWLDTLYDIYSRNVIPAIGRVVAGDADSYRYLVESIRKFPNQARFAEMLKAAGFERVAWRNLSGGIVAIHSGWKL